MAQGQAAEPANGPFAPTFAGASAGKEAALAAAASYAVPIFWVVPAGDGQGPHRNGRVRNGTLFVVDAGVGPFAVSANHVYEGYAEAKAKHPGTRCRVLPKPDGRRRAPLAFDPEARLIDRIRDPDIATFRITIREVARLGIGTVTNWPPRVPRKGETVAFAGFPGGARRRIGRRDLHFEVYPGLALATSVNDRHISCQSGQEPAGNADGFRLPPQHYDTGGMSGGPLFTVGEAREPKGWRLGGVISQGSPALGILRASLAERLLPGGGLRR
ncbi:MAG: trypsin-like peptidase domain-containing protein [Proteobacteria bacterium]|nr:trypsin-like peptidase domain-containing protein [Pseudomonadota bacterium]